VTFRKKVYSDLETLQTDLDEYMSRFNNERTHQEKSAWEKPNGNVPRWIAAVYG